jgi:hypothetical protein
LVAEPELRFGLKQIKQNVWFNSYKPKKHLEVDQKIVVHKKLLREMKETCPEVDVGFTRCCLEANVKNSLTSFYHLLVKKKNLLQESLSDLA